MNNAGEAVNTNTWLALEPDIFTDIDSALCRRCVELRNITDEMVQRASRIVLEEIANAGLYE